MYYIIVDSIRSHNRGRRPYPRALIHAQIGHSRVNVVRLRDEMESWEILLRIIRSDWRE